MSRTQPLATVLRRVTVSSRPSTTARLTTRRFASTVPADKPRSWRSGLLRWGVAGAIVYYYNTTNIFAEAPAYNTQNSSLVDSSLPTLDSVTAERRQRAVAAAPRAAALADSPATASSSATASVVAVDNSQPPSSGPDGALSPGELEEEADQQGAFNPETGEINWDCPCLGGMAHGPCGENFKAAFSCFVFSKEEPKGVDCIDKFKAMQDCFREHPDIYGSELDDDEDEEGGDAPTAAETAAAGSITPSSTDSVATPSPVKTNTANTPSQDSQAPRSDASSNPDAVKVGGKGSPTKAAAKASTERAKAAGKQVASDFGAKEAQSESEDAVPKAWHDAADSQPKTEK